MIFPIDSLLNRTLILPLESPAGLMSSAGRLWKLFRAIANTIPGSGENCSSSHRNHCSPCPGIPTQPEAEARMILDRLKLELPAQPPPRITASDTPPAHASAAG